MDNKENILTALEDFGSGEGKNEIPEILDKFIKNIANTGETIFPWLKLKPLFTTKVDISMKEFQTSMSMDTLSPLPNVENVKFDAMRKRILERLAEFTGAPFTIQRLAELVVEPRKHYKRTDKFLRAIEKNIMVVSSVDPYGNKIVNDSKLLNGGDVNGSLFTPPAPMSSPAGGNTATRIEDGSPLPAWPAKPSDSMSSQTPGDTTPFNPVTVMPPDGASTSGSKHDPESTSITSSLFTSTEPKNAATASSESPSNGSAGNATSSTGSASSSTGSASSNTGGTSSSSGQEAEDAASSDGSEDSSLGSDKSDSSVSSLSSDDGAAPQAQDAAKTTADKTTPLVSDSTSGSQNETETKSVENESETTSEAAAATKQSDSQDKREEEPMQVESDSSQNSEQKQVSTSSESNESTASESGKKAAAEAGQGDITKRQGVSNEISQSEEATLASKKRKSEEVTLQGTPPTKKLIADDSVVDSSQEGSRRESCGFETNPNCESPDADSANATSPQLTDATSQNVVTMTSSTSSSQDDVTSSSDQATAVTPQSSDVPAETSVNSSSDNLSSNTRSDVTGSDVTSGDRQQPQTNSAETNVESSSTEEKSTDDVPKGNETAEKEVKMAEESNTSQTEESASDKAEMSTDTVETKDSESANSDSDKT